MTIEWGYRTITELRAILEDTWIDPDERSGWNEPLGELWDVVIDIVDGLVRQYELIRVNESGEVTTAKGEAFDPPLTRDQIDAIRASHRLVQAFRSIAEWHECGRATTEVSDPGTEE